MGVIDTVYVSADVVAAWGFRCHSCGGQPKPDQTWQTKDLGADMSAYYLRADGSGDVRLYFLDPPSDRRFWRAWTAAEVAEGERRAADGTLSGWLQRKVGEGHFLPEAHLPLHRRQRSMGELPHQWVQIGRACGCGHLVEYWLKFDDGIATEPRAERPLPSQSPIDRAGLDP